MHAPNNLPSACSGHIHVPTGKWWIPRGARAEDFSYCDFCIKNGCYDPTKMTEFINFGNTSAACDCTKQKDHPTMRMIPKKSKAKPDCCPGEFMVNSLDFIWYEDLDGHIVCEFCIKNNCVDEKMYTKINESSGDLVCVCKKQHATVPRVICEKCKQGTSKIDQFKCGCGHNVDHSHCNGDECRNIITGINVPNKLCYPCAYLQKSCAKCGIKVN
jgi:hypothetical protein